MKKTSGSGKFIRGLLPTLVVVGVAVALPSASLAQSTVYLPAQGQLQFLPILGITGGSSLVITVLKHGLKQGSAVWIQDVKGIEAANGFFRVSVVDVDHFSLQHLYYGSNVRGTGLYQRGSGTVTPLSAYQLVEHPRGYQDGASGTLTASLADRQGKANKKNPPYEAMYNTVGPGSDFRSKYKIRDVDSEPLFLHRYAAAAYYWSANKDDSTALAMARWGINHVEQIFRNDDFYCDVSGSQCANRNNSSEMDYGSFEIVPLLNAYSLVRGKMSADEIRVFADKILNDNDISHNGIGGSAENPDLKCSNVVWSGNWSPDQHYCGFTFLMRHLTYSPAISPGQESHYTPDYGMATEAGEWDLPPHASNLTATKLLGYIATGLALADDDPRARMLLTQAFSYWYKWYWSYAKSSWTPLSQLGSRYILYRGPYATEIVEMMKNSGGPDLSQGTYLRRFLPYVLFDTLPDNPGPGLTDTWGDVFGSADNAQDAYTAAAVALGLYSGDTYAPYVRYWMHHTIGNYDANSMGGGGNPDLFGYSLLPYVFVDPKTEENSFKSLPTQFLFRDTDYDECIATFGKTGCYANRSFGAAISKSDWSKTATQVLIQSGFNPRCYDHAGEGDWGAYHIYRNGYLLAGSGSNRRGANGTGHKGACSGTLLGSDMVIQIGSGDAWEQDAPAFVTRWAGVDPEGDAQSRYMYLMSDLTKTYVPGVRATRVQRQIVHFKNSGSQDYLISYDDVATISGSRKIAYWHYWTTDGDVPDGGLGAVTYDENSRTATDTRKHSRLLSRFLAVGDPNSIAITTPVKTEHTTQITICASTNGTECSDVAASGEWIVVHKPSLDRNDSLPEITQPDAGPEWTVLEIADTHGPKVAAFARHGKLLTSLTFSDSHSGKAQYLIGGLVNGSYRVSNGTESDACRVVGNDNTCYFEMAAGKITITASSTKESAP